jgi:MoaA/NifB/PqqE/SkfB family radical SAM enzyme
MKAITTVTTTICPKMWDSVFIAVTGDVYFCCRRSPMAIGNIYEQHLDEIWQGPTAAMLRQQSLDGELGCHANCTLLSSAHKSFLPAAMAAPKLRKVHLEHHEFCNIDCIMCYQHDGRKPGFIPNTVLWSKINFDGLAEVQLQGGEPLAFKQCRELFLWLVQERGIPVTLQTNGLLITDELARIIATHCNEIMIAINGATKEIHELVNYKSDWNRLLTNIRRLQDARLKAGSRLVIEGQMTLVRENVHELPDFIRLGETLGLHSLAVSWEESVPEYLAAKPALFNRVREELCTLLSSPLFLKPKHAERLAVLFDVVSSDPRIRTDRLPLLQRTETYREKLQLVSITARP